MNLNISFDDHDDHDDDDDDTFQESEIPIPRPIRFWLVLLLNIPSIICSLLLLFHLLVNKNFRQQLTNHVIIILLIIGLIIELIDIPFHLSFLNLGVVQPSTPFLCLVWWFMDMGLYNGCTMIMALGSIERYFLIFHDRMYLMKKKRFIFHYIPYLLLFLYIFIFYIIVIFFPPCMNKFDYTLPVCNDFPCYLDNPLLGIWDSIINSILPTFIITISSVILLLRVYYQKRRLHRPNLWRRQRKMTIQLICLCVLYLIPNIPLNILIFAHLCGLPDSVGVEPQLLFDFLCYFVIVLYPFVCYGASLELRKKVTLRGLFLLKQPQQVAIVEPQ